MSDRAYLKRIFIPAKQCAKADRSRKRNPRRTLEVYYINIGPRPLSGLNIHYHSGYEGCPKKKARATSAWRLTGGISLKKSIKSDTSFRSGIIPQKKERIISSLDNNSYRPECHLLFDYIAESSEPASGFSSCICLRTATQTSRALLPSLMPTIGWRPSLTQDTKCCSSILRGSVFGKTGCSMTSTRFPPLCLTQRCTEISCDLSTDSDVSLPLLFPSGVSSSRYSADKNMSHCSVGKSQLCRCHVLAISPDASSYR